MRTGRVMPFGRGSRGFTLLEILVAVVAFAIMLTAVHAVFRGALRLRDEASDRTRDLHERSRALAMIRQDLQSAYYSGGRLASMIQGQALPDGGMTSDRLLLTATDGRIQEDQPWGDVQEIEYQVVDAEQLNTGPNPTTVTNLRERVLVRSVWRNLLTPIREMPSQQSILRRVERFQVFFFDGQDWLETWDTTLNQSEETGVEAVLPEAIRVRVDFAWEDRKERRRPPLELVVPWMTQPLVVETNTVAEAESESGSDGQSSGGGGGAPTPPGNNQPARPGGGRG